MNNYSEILELFASDMQKYSSDDKVTRFVYQNKTHFLISALVGSKKEGLSFEELCQTISTNICSRSTIQKVLENAEKSGVYIKTINSDDKRIRQYQLSPSAVAFFLEWIKRQSTIFSFSKKH